jgi:hypothetical protein
MHAIIDIDRDDWPFRRTSRFTKKAWFHWALSISPFTRGEVRCSFQSLAHSGKPYNSLKTSINSVSSLCTNCRAIGSTRSIILAMYTGILITCLLSGFKYAFKYATKGFIGRFEDNRELWSKGIGRSPFPSSRHFEIFRETPLKTLV